MMDVGIHHRLLASKDTWDDNIVCGYHSALEDKPEFIDTSTDEPGITNDLAGVPPTL